VVMVPAVMMVMMVPPMMMVAIKMEAPAMVPPVIMVTTSVVVVAMVMVPATDVLQRHAVSLLYDAIRDRGWRSLRWECKHP
jgi:hypothetical protein